MSNKDIILIAKNIDDVIDAYTSYANNANKCIIAYGDDPYTRKMKIEKEIIYYGLESNNDIRATNIKYHENGVSFDIEGYGHFDLPLYGKHQLLDCLAVITVCSLEGISASVVQNNLSKFKGAKRRFTETKVGNNVIIDDYAHHPTEIAATLEATKNTPHDELWVIFQPHTYTRTYALLDQFAKVLSTADHVVLADIYAAREKDTGMVSSKDLCEKINSMGGNAIHIGDFLSIEKFVEKSCKKNDLLITMGAGNVDIIGDSLLKK